MSRRVSSCTEHLPAVVDVLSADVLNMALKEHPLVGVECEADDASTGRRVKNQLLGVKMILLVTCLLIVCLMRAAYARK